MPSLGQDLIKTCARPVRSSQKLDSRFAKTLYLIWHMLSLRSDMIRALIQLWSKQLNFTETVLIKTWRSFGVTQLLNCALTQFNELYMEVKRSQELYVHGLLPRVEVFLFLVYKKMQFLMQEMSGKKWVVLILKFLFNFFWKDTFVSILFHSVGQQEVKLEFWYCLFSLKNRKGSKNTSIAKAWSFSVFHSRSSWIQKFVLSYGSNSALDFCQVILMALSVFKLWCLYGKLNVLDFGVFRLRLSVQRFLCFARYLMFHLLSRSHWVSLKTQTNWA